jgi:hypothetical protein
MSERACPTRTGRSRESLNVQEIRNVIEYISTYHTTKVLNWEQLRNELKLKCFPKTLKHSCNETGYYSYICCQKPNFSKVQVNTRWIWAITYIFWTI